MDRLKQKQTFCRMVIDLLMYAVTENIPLQGGEWHRSQEEAARLAVAGKGIVNSKHIKSMAIDLWVLDAKGNPVFDKENPAWEAALLAYTKLGNRWVQLGGKWGGTFTRYNDVYHFEYADELL
jgi:hypothetical protein